MNEREEEETMNEHQIMRETLGALTGFCTGSEICGPDDGAEPALGRFAWYVEGAPGWLTEVEAEGAVTVFGFDLSGPPTIDGWVLAHASPLGEASCPRCGDGTGEEHRRPECQICEGGGYVYLGCEAWLAVYRPPTPPELCVILGREIYRDPERDGRAFARKDAPEWVSGLAVAVAAEIDGPLDMLDAIYSVLGACDGHGLPDPDGLVDVYTADLTAWYGTSSGYYWTSEAESEGLVADDATALERVAAGQYAMYRTIVDVLEAEIEDLRSDWASRAGGSDA
jgi:hypothetical protein